ncbi:transcription initiation factor TFIIIB, Brf1 subunit/transcription initiation factor TFIIB [Methanomethylovorans hollandica DSM 15978]|uniref:Transcription initiation factor TFIIIB, Brf1 subunit/transcription initiation factor TFIIB n=1 Tax=Methanomethylovorans hollandica (strain DSM 15978 / NBRC 107637 / DMS1) TaxID=867904 RepID=L0KZK9_METHD|nr:TFIIB-type zinc ribbon-containing protein [Methanomethylovorans hollandica]AGB49424.1 transcription initiation factor TFIIIB, Brf1 subunit/transcription initiation factor TFIIB [Methanomethylovorans hollandica DSM 15978]
MKVCPECNSARLYRRIFAAEYRCTKCGLIFITPKIVDVPRDYSISTGVLTAIERKQRLEKIAQVHKANPHYTRTDLKMVCFESYYMVSRYWKEVYNSQMTMNKTG